MDVAEGVGEGLAISFARSARGGFHERCTQLGLEPHQRGRRPVRTGLEGRRHAAYRGLPSGARRAGRRTLLHELLRVELAMRRRANEKPSQEEYRNRFPKDHAVIDAVFGPDSHRAGEKRPTESSKATDAGRASAASPANPIPAELAGIADYEIIRKLGGGTMGLVFLAAQSDHGP